MITKLQYKLLSFFFCFSDAAEPWQLGLQDPATPVVGGMIFFHDYLMFFLIVIGFFVMWMLYKILKNFDENTNFSIINFTHSSPLEFIWTANRVDVILLTSIFLFSLFFYSVTVILKINFLIFKLRIKIQVITNIIGLLDDKLISMAQQADNRMITTAIGIAVVIVIGLLCFFFSGGGPGGSSIPSDSFTPRGSEGSLLNHNLIETLDKAKDLLLPTLARSNWLDSANNQISFFQQSYTVKVGNSVKEWLLALNTSSKKMEEKGEMSVDVLQSVVNTVDSIEDTLPGFLFQLERFLAGANLNKRVFSETKTSDHDFILSCRDVAKELLEKLVENEALLTGMVPSSFAFPEWFPGLLCFFSTLNVACSKELDSLPKQILKIFNQLRDYHFKSDNVECLSLKNYLEHKLYHCYTKMTALMNNTTEHTSSVNYLYTARKKADLDAIPDLLAKLHEHHELLNVDPNHIFLFLG